MSSDPSSTAFSILQIKDVTDDLQAGMITMSLKRPPAVPTKTSNLVSWIQLPKFEQYIHKNIYLGGTRKLNGKHLFALEVQKCYAQLNSEE